MLAAEWRFCVHCGLALTRPHGVPGAIRPADAASASLPSRVGHPAVGIVLAVIGLGAVTATALALVGVF